MDNSEKLMEKIKDGRINPRPRWQFSFKDRLAWSGFIISVLFGALAFSVVLFAIQQVDFNILSYMGKSVWAVILGLIPLIWIIALIILLVLAILSLMRSKKGYKIPSLTLIATSTAVSILAGTLFFITGGGKWLEHAFASEVNIYQGVEERKTILWMMPDEGYLGGTIASVDDDEFELLDFEDHTWIIDFEGADIPPAVSLTAGVKVKIIGNKISEGSFKAEKIRPWGGMGRMHRNGVTK